MIRGRRLAAGYFDDRWVVPPRSKGPRAPETVKPQFPQGDLPSLVRWELPARAPTRVGITSPDLQSPLVSSLSMQEGDDTRVWVGIGSDAREAAQVAYVDAVLVDDGCKPFAPGADRILAPVANFLHNLDSELRRCGLVIHSKVFETSKERLALANISGAMMIQATVPTAFGMFFTSWILSASSILAAIVTVVAVMFLQWIFRSERANSLRLAQVGWLYAVFAAVLIAQQIGSPLG